MPYDLLSPRESEIATLVASGKSNKEIARELALSLKTVKNTLTKVFVKTNTHSRTQLAVQMVLTGGMPMREWPGVGALSE